MYHEGSLQDGITQAVQESKSVLCFVTDESEESNKWQNDWLQDQNIPNAVARHAIAFRIKAGSEEANFLSAVCPISETPTVAIIHQGQLRDQLKRGITKNEFTIRLLQAIRSARDQPSQPNPAQQQTLASTAQPAPTGASNTSSSSDQAPSNVSNNASSPSSRPQAPQPSQDPPQPQAQPTSSSPRRRKHDTTQQDQVRRKQEAKQERARILTQIENDKIERRRREEERKQAAQLNSDNQTVPPSVPIDTNARSAPQPATNSPSQHAKANIQVRLPDGSTIRQGFPSTAPINDVRKWINEQTNESDGYSLRHVLTPAPSVVISPANDKSAATLSSLDLAPSATLVMIPSRNKVPGAGSSAAAPVAGQAAGAINTLWIYITMLVNAMTHLILYLVEKGKIFLGIGDAAPAATAAAAAAAAAAARPNPQATKQAPSTTPDAASARTSGSDKSNGQANTAGIRIRTLRDQRDEEGRDNNQFYNGNRLSFEPNVNDQDDEDGRPD